MHDKKTGEYRLFNDRWYKRGNKAENNCGLWIVRDGMGQEVHRDTRGTRLLPGDEIHLGKAVVKFQIKYRQIERLLEIGQQIAPVFDADGDAHQAVGDAGVRRIPLR